MNVRSASRLVLAASVAAVTLGLPADAVRTAAAADVLQNYVYVFDNSSSPRIHGFLLGTDGSLTAVPGSPFFTTDGAGDCSGFCNAATWSAARGFVLTAGATGITSWSVAADGALTETLGSPFATTVSSPVTSVAAVQRGDRTFAYVSQYFAKTLDGFEVAADGTLSHLAGFPKKKLNQLSVTSGAGDKLVGCDEAHHGMFSFKVSASGAVKKAPRAPVKVAGKGSLYFAVIHPTAKFAYTADYARGHSVYGFKIASSGALSKLAGKPLSLGIANADGGLAFASPSLMYAVESNGDGGADVQAVAIGTKGTMSKLGGAQTSGMSNIRTFGASPDGAFLVAASNDDGEVRSYAIDAVTGALTQADVESVSLGSANGIAFVTR